MQRFAEGKKSRFNHQKMIFYICLLAVFFIPAQAYMLARGYKSDDTALTVGMFVALSADSTAEDPKVERASSDNVQRAVGVISTGKDSTINVSSGKQQVLVQNDGDVEAYVSNLNGVIKKGDLLAISPLKGILSKHLAGPGVVAIALQDINFDKGVEELSVTSPEGDQKVKIIKSVVTLDRTAISSRMGVSAPDSTLAKLGKSFVGKTVSEIRVVTALVIFLLVLIVEGSIIYGAVSSAIVSIGRNPLARKEVTKELIRVAVVAVCVLSLGLGATYVILWI